MQQCFRQRFRLSRSPLCVEICVEVRQRWTRLAQPCPSTVDHGKEQVSGLISGVGATAADFCSTRAENIFWKCLAPKDHLSCDIYTAETYCEAAGIDKRANILYPHSVSLYRSWLLGFDLRQLFAYRAFEQLLNFPTVRLFVLRPVCCAWTLTTGVLLSCTCTNRFCRSFRSDLRRPYSGPCNCPWRLLAKIDWWICCQEFCLWGPALYFGAFVSRSIVLGCMHVDRAVMHTNVQ